MSSYDTHLKVRNEIDAAHSAAFAKQTQKMTLAAEKEALDVINRGVKVMQKIVEHLEKADLDGDYCKVCNRKGVSVAEASKAAANLVKVVNDIGRYVHFDRGEADSRTEVKGLDELLKLLSNDKFAQVVAWIEEAEAQNAVQ